MKLIVAGLVALLATACANPEKQSARCQTHSIGNGQTLTECQ
ncbi:hypothetical protein [Bosea sp. (in: a-proteobacteria)]